MGFWKKLFSRKKKEEYIEEIEESAESEALHRDQVDLKDQSQRQRYVKSCLEQLADAESEMETLRREYGAVTSYLTDMEEIEALPPAERKELSAIADKITAYEREKHLYEDGKTRMPEAQFRQLERMEEEIAEGIKKLTEAEEYQEKIRQDMRRLSAEKHAYQYRKHDLSNVMVNMRGMMIITSFAFVTCMAILLLLQALLEMDIGIGYILTAAATAFAVFLIYMKYTESAKEKRQVERAINRLILLQNRVKIRYVNNTNLLDYLYVKYSAQSAEELSGLWEAYQTEKEERQKVKELHAELDFHRGELLRFLRRFQIKDPEIWLRQTEAITNPKEMVEIRHGLILRRQKLRRQMEYNERIAESAQGEIKSLVEEFPAYAPEIMEMVSQYENRGD
ncbi:MAG: hypothetical protein J6C33_10145 [Lachnospiraceae bacterium]|nr:hypothetical protein [Lachnospiraceae bacterium]